MNFDLIIKEPLNILDDFDFEVYESDSMVEIFSIIEEAIDQTEKVDFHFKCFSEQFNLTVFGDLSVFLEQLIPLYKLVQKEHSEYLLDFYEVGTDQKLMLKTVDNQILVIDLNSPNKQEYIDPQFLKENIMVFVNKLRDIVNRTVPSINEIIELERWYLEFER